MKASIKKRLKKPEETLKGKSAPLDPVIIYDPEAPFFTTETACSLRYLSTASAKVCRRPSEYGIDTPK